MVGVLLQEYVRDMAKSFYHSLLTADEIISVIKNKSSIPVVYGVKMESSA